MLNRQQESASLKAELENVTYTQETINLENAIIKTKINQMKRERDSYLEWRRSQTSMKNNEIMRQNNINWSLFFLYSQFQVKFAVIC